MVYFVLAASIAAIGLVVLGLMREVVILRGDIRALVQTLTGEVLAPEIGAEMPRSLREALRRELDPATSARFLIFLSPTCSGCEAIVRDLRAVIDRPGVVAVVLGKPEPAFLGKIAEVAVATIVDEAGRIFDDTGVTATPTLMEIDDGAGAIRAFSVGGNASWITERVAQVHEMVTR